MRWSMIFLVSDDVEESTQRLRRMLLQSRPFTPIFAAGPDAAVALASCGAIARAAGLKHDLVSFGAAVTPIVAVGGLMDGVDAEFLAICGIGASYPSSYLAEAESLFSRDGDEVAVVAACPLVQQDGFGRTLCRTVRVLALRRFGLGRLAAELDGSCFRVSHVRRALHASDDEPCDAERLMRSMTRHGRLEVAASHWYARAGRHSAPSSWRTGFGHDLPASARAVGPGGSYSNSVGSVGSEVACHVPEPAWNRLPLGFRSDRGGTIRPGAGGDATDA